MTVASAPLGLARACHFGPTLVVTVGVTAVAASLGRSWQGVIAVGFAVLLGQLSVGWSNDATDAPADRAAARREKPIIAGLVSEKTVRTAAYISFVLCVPLSYIAAGPIGGTAHIVAVGSAWAYNLWLKTTVVSVLPYVLSFGLVAPFLTYGLTPAQRPALWFVVTMACLGLAAGMANAIPDIDSDLTIDNGGLVARIGARGSALIAAISVAIATVLLVLHLELSPATTTVIMVLAAGAIVVGASAAHGRHLFKVVMLLGLTDAALLCFVGASAVVR